MFGQKGAGVAARWVFRIAIWQDAERQGASRAGCNTKRSLKEQLLPQSSFSNSDLHEWLLRLGSGWKPLASKRARVR